MLEAVVGMVLEEVVVVLIEELLGEVGELFHYLLRLVLSLNTIDKVNILFGITLYNLPIFTYEVGTLPLSPLIFLTRLHPPSSLSSKMVNCSPTCMSRWPASLSE